MTDLIKIGAAFALIVLLLRQRLNLGLVMLAGAVCLGVFYRIGPLEQAQVVLRSSIDPITINLVTGLVLIMVLENIIRKKGLLKRMMEAVVNVARDRRIAMAVLPGVIGLLPSAGGAAFSAPMVQDAAAEVAMEPEHKAFVNYWFRHIWECISPLYPGVVLAAAVTKVPIHQFLLSQLPIPLAVIGAGALLGFRGIKTGAVQGSQSATEIKTLFVTLLPITISIILVVVFGMPLSLAMISIVVGMFAFYRYTPGEVLTTLRESFSINIVLMTVGIMVFKGMLDASGAIDALPAFFRESGLPTGIVLFALPFIVGLLTGLTVGFVGATFPIITALLGGNPDLGSITFAFASGFAGMMLSPTHLCLLLTIQYFKADMAGTYRLMYVPVLLVFLAGLIRLWV
jgi:integral membrane protein (TIGR00529 family)